MVWFVLALRKNNGLAGAKRTNYGAQDIKNQNFLGWLWKFPRGAGIEVSIDTLPCPALRFALVWVTTFNFCGPSGVAKNPLGSRAHKDNRTGPCPRCAAGRTKTLSIFLAVATSGTSPVDQILETSALKRFA